MKKRKVITYSILALGDTVHDLILLCVKGDK